MTTQDSSTERLETEIDALRADLAETVDQLAYKLDVKAQARARLGRLGPRQIAVAVGAVAALGALVWWRHR